MESKTRIMALQRQIYKLITSRVNKIIAIDSGGQYDALAEISRHLELLVADARAALIDGHNELQALGCRPAELPIPNASAVEVQIDADAVRVLLDAMLPYPIKGGAHYLHGNLEAALTQYERENAFTRPLFTERCAVVFIHHYAKNGTVIRNMRDYDNVERRCITNVIARHFLRDDSPACYVSMDILAPGDSDYTEIRVLTIPAFRELIQSSEIEYIP